MLKISVHTDGLESIKNIMQVSCTKAEHVVAAQMLADTRPFVPASSAMSLDTRTRIEGHSIGEMGPGGNGAFIVYPGPYARFLYFGKLMIDPNTGSSWAPKNATKEVTGTDLNFNKTVHPKAQAHWFEASKAQNLEKWERLAKKAVKHEF